MSMFSASSFILAYLGSDKVNKYGYQGITCSWEVIKISQVD